MKSMRIISTIGKRTDNSNRNRRSGRQGIDADPKHHVPSETIISADQSKTHHLSIRPSFKRNVYGAPRINQYALYANEELSPRSSSWLYLSVASIACLSSFLITENYINDAISEEPISDDGGRSSIDTALISLLSISFAISFLITLFYHHRDLRDNITTDLPLVHNSLEFILSIVLFGFWCTVLRYASDPYYFSISTSSIDGNQDMFNSNIWVCTWIGFGLSSHLVGSLIMATSVRKRGVVCTNIDFMLSARRNTTPRSDCPMMLAADERWGEDGVVYWFMLLAFSSALAGFSISTRVGAPCETGDLSASAFCKRSSLGGAIGIMCGLLAFAALVLHRLNKKGTFDVWGSKKKFIVLRIHAMLACLSLVLQSVNVGFGTNRTGPSTDINNSYIASLMGVILSLMLCEQAKNRSLLRLLPPPQLRVENEVVENNLTNEDVCHIDEDDSASSSSSHASSSSAASSASAESFESSSECAVVTTPNPADHIIETETTDVECGFSESSGDYDSHRRDHSSCDRNSVSEDADASASECTSSEGSLNDPSRKDTYSTYHRTQLPPTYSPSSSPPHPVRSSVNEPHLPPPFATMNVENTPQEAQRNSADDDSSSYVELSFQPDDDVSSIGFSAIPGDKFGQEPDGYKYDDLYAPSDDPMVAENFPVMMVSRKKMRQQVTSHHHDNHSALAPVSESTAFTEPCSTSTASTHQRKVEEIMNRRIDKSTYPYAASYDNESWTDSDSSDHDGPPTINSIGNSIDEV